MSRTIINFWLDTLLLILFTSLVWVILVLRFAFPPALQAAKWTLWGLGFQQWMNVQFGLTCAMAAAVLLHVMLHWSWVWGVVASRIARGEGKKTKADEGTRTLWGVGLLIVVLHVLAIGLAAAVLCIRGPAV